MRQMCFATLFALAFGPGLPIAAVISATPLWAGQTIDASWPCIQRKVNEISIGQMWPLPLDAGKSDELPPQSLALINNLSLRRISEDEAKTRVAEFIKLHPETGTGELGKIYVAILARINQDRARLIEGIGRYAASQQQRSLEITRLRDEMAVASAASNPDYDKIDELEKQLDWSERIYRERETSLQYVCETPVLLEKRAYAIARILLPYASKQ